MTALATTSTGLFFIGYALFQLPSNLCCMVIGAPRWLAIIVATWGAVACLFATLRSKAQFYVLRLLLGMVCCCMCCLFVLMMAVYLDAHACMLYACLLYAYLHVPTCAHPFPQTPFLPETHFLPSFSPLSPQTEAGAYPAMYHHMLHFFSDQELGVAYTFTASATALAGLVGGPIAAGCLCMDGLGGLAGWQWLFLLEGIPTIVFGLSIPVRV